MLRLTLAQMRLSLGRLAAAAGLAITIGTAFVATTLIAGGVIMRTGYDAVTRTFADADFVVDGDLTGAELDAIRAADHVRAAVPLFLGGTELRSDRAGTWQFMIPATSDDRLQSLSVTSGRLPERTGEVAISEETADRLHATVGGELETSRTEYGPDSDGPVEVTVPVTVVGIVDDPLGTWAESGGAGVAMLDDVVAWTGADDLDALGMTTVLVAADGDVEASRAAVARAVPEERVLTKDEAAAETVSRIAGGGNALVMVVLGFAAVALLVAALVIANTFQVLVAQRSRALALLRCVGAQKAQLRRSVLLEAAIVGAVASLVGVVTGSLLAQGALSILVRTDLGAMLPTTITLTAAVVMVPILVGTLVTVLASLVPARAATRVPPIAALNAAPDGPAGRSGRARLVVSLVLVGGGAVGLVVADLAAVQDVTASDYTLPAGVLAGTASFVGVVLGAVFWVPRVLSLAGRALARTGSTARLAAANTVRNPRRTAATSTALLIGVTLVAMMSTGAESARSSLAQEMNQRYPVDLVVEEGRWTDDPLAGLATVQSTIPSVDGVESVALVPSAGVLVDGEYFTVLAPDDEAVAQLRDASMLDGLTDETIVVSEVFAKGRDGAPEEVQAVADDGSGTGTALHLRPVVADISDDVVYVLPAVFQRIDPPSESSVLWGTVEEGADAATVLQDVRDLVGEDSMQVVSAAAARQSNERAIDALLGIVVGLLAVAVVIALVGVTNTLSLSVIERRRESATLRAIGLTRSRLRQMLAVEGALIAGVGALAGVVLGLLYGWAGSVVVFGSMRGLELAVPWSDLVLVLVVALLAGLFASVLPSRTAARTPPVAALAID